MSALINKVRFYAHMRKGTGSRAASGRAETERKRDATAGPRSFAWRVHAVKVNGAGAKTVVWRPRIPTAARRCQA